MEHKSSDPTYNVETIKKKRPALKKITLKKAITISNDDDCEIINSFDKILNSKSAKTHKDLDLSREIDENKIVPISEILLDIENESKNYGKLFIGNLKGAKDLALLKELGIEYVLTIISKVNLTELVETYKKEKISHLYIEAPDSKNYN